MTSAPASSTNSAHPRTPVSYEDADVVLAAGREPVGEMAGDGLDFARDDDRLTFAVFDAMGSEARRAELVAHVVATYRQARAEQLDLFATAAQGRAAGDGQVRR